MCCSVSGQLVCDNRNITLDQISRPFTLHPEIAAHSSFLKISTTVILQPTFKGSFYFSSECMNVRLSVRCICQRRVFVAACQSRKSKTKRVRCLLQTVSLAAALSISVSDKHTRSSSARQSTLFAFHCIPARLQHNLHTTH